MSRFSILLLIILIAGTSYWKHYQNIQQQVAATEQALLEKPRTDEEIRQSIRQSLNGTETNTIKISTTTKQSTPTAISAFKCDGRQYCSQMTSCDEAKFFLSSCPGVKMDNYGRGNGVPCESQWCIKQR